MKKVLSLAGVLMLAACGNEGDLPAPIQQQIPEQFHGLWDAENSDCANATHDRMAIAEDKIEFFIPAGEVTSVEADGDDIVVNLRLEAEGESWDADVRLSLAGEGDGQRLEADLGEDGQSTLKRCDV